MLYVYLTEVKALRFAVFQARFGNEAVYQVLGEMHDIVGQARVSKMEQVVC